MYKIKISLKCEKGIILSPGGTLRLDELPDIAIENSEDLKEGKSIYVEVIEVQRYW